MPTEPRPEPADAAERRAAPPVVCYPPESLPAPPMALYDGLRVGMTRVAQLEIPALDARAFRVPAGHVLRISCTQGPQVGDLNLWNAHDLSERFYSGKTRALHGTHVTTGHRLWSGFPHLRPMATVIADSLGWYGFDADGAGVHDVIGTRCDPYTNAWLGGAPFYRCCHSNLIRALAAETGLAPDAAEPHVHDVLNVFMCTGFTRDRHRYFTKASPVRPGDHFDLFAEIDLLCALSACPRGDCSGNSTDHARCHPLGVEIFAPAPGALVGWTPPEPAPYDRSHGL
ncbi:urea carboxylase-associated family protein [Rhodovulum sulfidophilum]|uniref:urea carboxylase-associated family protein n=1 Tax=Rhodovulum sulfidophilum TaxID=35806 RepID=UPI000952ADE3|nr:DUF1989 domain-containing protein [Rhodovulum sulfidophilum]OLS50631.1 hypothetical protein BV392_00500 [Rhodovulum sulfidophilum]